MSFEELQRLKEEMGAKLYNEKIMNVKRRKPITEFKRANKNRPREMSSKRPMPVACVVQAKQVETRDPRFDPLCGSFEEKTFKSNYKFIDKIKENEREALVKELEETEDVERRRQIKYLIQRMKNQKHEKLKHEKKAVDNKPGEKPQFLKKCTVTFIFIFETSNRKIFIV